MLSGVQHCQKCGNDGIAKKYDQGALVDAMMKVVPHPYCVEVQSVKWMEM